MDKERFLNSGILEKYVLGIATAKEIRQVERYAEAFPEIREEIAAMRHAMEQYAQQYAIDPPKDLKGKIMGAIEDESVPKPHIGGRSERSGNAAIPVRWRAIAAGVAIVLLATGAAYFYNQSQDLLSRSNALQLAYSDLKAECEMQTANYAALTGRYDFLKHSRTTPVPLTGTANAPGAKAVVYWNDLVEGAFLNLDNMPPPPPGKQYQIWADVEGKMVDMGLIEFDPTQLQPVRFIANAESLNITLEPEGGSLHPTVELLMVNGGV